MIPLLFILCLSVSGSETQDCTSYEWEIISDRQHFESLAAQYMPTRDPQTSQGFTTDNMIYVSNSPYAIKVRVHETDHAICNLENPIDSLDCSVKVDVRDNQLIGQTDERGCGWCTEHVKPKSDVWRYM